MSSPDPPRYIIYDICCRYGAPHEAADPEPETDVYPGLSSRSLSEPRQESKSTSNITHTTNGNLAVADAGERTVEADASPGISSRSLSEPHEESKSTSNTALTTNVNLAIADADGPDSGA